MTPLSRHCAACDREVLDLSGMHAEAAIDALIAREGKTCLRYRTDATGEIQFAPPPPRRPGLIATAALAVTAWAGWAEDPAAVPPGELGMCIPDADDEQAEADGGREQALTRRRGLGGGLVVAGPGLADLVELTVGVVALALARRGLEGHEEAGQVPDRGGGGQDLLGVGGVVGGWPDQVERESGCELVADLGRSLHLATVPEYGARLQGTRRAAAQRRLPRICTE